MVSTTLRLSKLGRNADLKVSFILFDWLVFIVLFVFRLLFTYLIVPYHKGHLLLCRVLQTRARPLVDHGHSDFRSECCGGDREFVLSLVPSDSAAERGQGTEKNPKIEFSGALLTFDREASSLI